MIKQQEGEARATYLMRVASAYISNHPDYEIDYDETTCDGYCLSEELGIEAEEATLAKGKQEWISVDTPPEVDGPYWCYDPTEKYIQQSVFVYSSYLEGFNNGNVTHWRELMPLPEAPSHD